MNEIYTLVLLRHGESVWNKENLFTGWTDVALSEKGEQEALTAGKLLEKEKIQFDVAYTSVLTRAIHTLNISLQAMGQLWIPVIKDWRLNERHYGALQGLNKAETAEKYGDEQVLTWRRSYDISPPALQKADSRNALLDRRYATLDPEKIPLAESLHDTIRRVVPFWENTIAPSIQKGKTVVIAAHGNSLRALVKHLDKISDTDVVSLNIPTGEPLIYKLDKQLMPVRHYYLGDHEELRQTIERKGTVR